MNGRIHRTANVQKGRCGTPSRAAAPHLADPLSEDPVSPPSTKYSPTEIGLHVPQIYYSARVSATAFSKAFATAATASTCRFSFSGLRMVPSSL